MVPDHLLGNAVGAEQRLVQRCPAARAGDRRADDRLGRHLAGVRVNTISFIAVLLGLFLMRPDQLHPAPVRRGRGAIREGIAYTSRTGLTCNWC